MPIYFTVDRALRQVAYVVEGDATPDEARAFLDAVLAHPEFRPGFDFLGDRRGVDRAPGTRYVRAAAGEMRARATDLRRCRWAAVSREARRMVSTNSKVWPTRAVMVRVNASRPEVLVVGVNWSGWPSSFGTAFILRASSTNSSIWRAVRPPRVTAPVRCGADRPPSNTPNTGRWLSERSRSR